MAKALHTSCHPLVQHTHLTQHLTHFTIDYQLEEFGWATVAFGDWTSDCWAVSVLHDALPDLAQAALKLGAGETKAQASFWGEPGELILRAERLEGDQLHLSLRNYPDWLSSGNCQESDGEAVAQGQLSVHGFVQAVYEAMGRLIAQHGRAGYEARWQEPFPQAEHEALRAWLKQHKRHA